MSIDHEALERQKFNLRNALKEWEARFYNSYGRKAGRDDIKADPAIAAKYKEYQKVQDTLSGKTTSRKSPKQQKRLQPETGSPDSPLKRRKSLHDTLAKYATSTTVQPIEDDKEQDLSTPAIKRTFIGPTPQKDGIVLGIFDLLPASTPSRSRTVLGEVDRNVAVTPSKPTDLVQSSPHQYEERARGSRTPASTGKRFMLDQFTTPQRQKQSKEEIETDANNITTPSSTSKHHFLTPAFLRRDNFVMTTIDEAPPTPKVQQPWKKRTFGRSLSGMIQDMRKEQDKEADEDLDLLRELEDGPAVSITVSATNAEPDCHPPSPKAVVAEESRRSDVLDRDGFIEDHEEQEVVDKQEGQEDDGNPPRKRWKKKGLKRQTRRVNMKPIAKRPQLQQTKSTVVDSDSSVDDTRLLSEDPQSVFEGGSEPEYFKRSAKTTDTAGKESKAKKSNHKALNNVTGPRSMTESEKKKVVRKVKPDAHANYRALKIKNKNSKAKGRGRFGRGR